MKRPAPEYIPLTVKYHKMNENIIRILAKISFALLLFSYPVCAISQETEDNLDINKTIEPLTKQGIFRDSVYYNWGGSIIKGEDGKYHLFYSRWKREYTFVIILQHHNLKIWVLRLYAV